MKVLKNTFLIILLLSLFVSSTFGLRTENFGGRPIRPSVDWPKGTLAVAESLRHVYSRWCNGGELFCYRGDAATFNEMLKKFAAIKAPAHQLHVETGYGKVESFKGKEITFNWRLDVTAGIVRTAQLEKGATEEELSPQLTYYVGHDAIAFRELILPENVEVVLSDNVRNLSGAEGMFEEALKWRTAKLKWVEFVRPFLEEQRNELKRTWPKEREIPLWGYVEFQSPLVRRYLPNYKIYIIETSLINVSKLFAVSSQGEVYNLKGSSFFSSKDGVEPFKNEMFSDFIRKQQIVASDANTAIEIGQFVEELVFASNRWMHFRYNSNDFKVFRDLLFSKEGTFRDPNWQWYSEKYNDGWIISRRYVGPPASILMPPRWKLVLDDQNKIVDIMH